MADIISNIEIPETWTKCELREVLSLKNGFAFQSSNYISEGIPVVRISDINDGYVMTGKSVKVKQKEEYEDYIVEKGDILIAMSGATTGKFGVYTSNEKAYQNQRVGNFKPHIPDLLNKQYVYYLLFALRDNILQSAYGGAQPNISSGKIEEFKIPLAPLNEQNRIVYKLDELLSELEKGKEQLQTSLEQLKVYRQSILKHAFEGELTATQRKKKQFGDTKELLKQLKEKGKELKIKLKYPKIKDDEELPTIPKDWQWIRNEELLKYVTSGSRDWKQYYSHSGSIFIRTQDIKTNNLSLENAAYVKLPTKTEGKRSLVELNDLLMTITGANVGKVALIEKEIPEAYVSQSVALMKYLDSRLTKYMWYYFQSRAFGQGLISNLVYGVGRPVLSLENMKEVPVALCSIEEQEAIVYEIENRFSVCDKMEAEILQALNQIEPLKQGLLQKAFEGKLVEQDPTDEPASVLLERIKKEREEYLKVEKEKKKSKPKSQKSKKMAEELKRIIEILKESKEPVSAKTLWQSSTHKDDIDDFYAALKKHIEAGEIIELPRKGKESFLKLADAK